MRSKIAFLLLLANLVWVIFFLSDYTNVWVQPEANSWRGNLSENRTWNDWLKSGFNWPLFEGPPRLTRPLSHLMEVVDHYARQRMWRITTPHPTLSVTFPFILVLTPILLYAVLRSKGVREFTALCGVALYFSNPGVLSLLAMGFRPGKAMAIASVAVVLWWASRLNGPSFARVVPLYLFLFLSLFWDETALIGYPALLLLFPRVVFSSRIAATTFFVMPIGYALTVRRLLPALYAFAGFPVTAGDSYEPLEKFSAWALFSSSRGARAEFNEFFFTNTRTALMDSLGLINPLLPGRFFYHVLFVAILSVIGIFGVLLIRRIRRRQENVRKNIPGPGIVIRSVAFLGISLVFHSVLLSVVGQGAWGVYWYGAFLVLGFVITTTILLEYIDLPSWTALVFVLLVSAGSFHVFSATNRAYKMFHYYPYRASLLRHVFDNEINRFRVPGPAESNAELRRYTQALSRRDEHSIAGAPMELLYLVYQLGLRGGMEGCRAYDTTFDVTPSSDSSPSPDGFHLECQDEVAAPADVEVFVGTWRTPAPVRIKPNDVSVVVFGAVPAMANIDGHAIEVPSMKLKGELSTDGNKIVWGNGQSWERRSGDLSRPDGRWWLKDPHAIRKARISDVLVTNDNYAGIVQSDAIMVPERDLVGALSSDRTKIFWNGMNPWVRQETR